MMLEEIQRQEEEQRRMPVILEGGREGGREAGNEKETKPLVVWGEDGELCFVEQGGREGGKEEEKEEEEEEEGEKEAIVAGRRRGDQETGGGH